jgi:hypothetical protein
MLGLAYANRESEMTIKLETIGRVAIVLAAIVFLVFVSNVNMDAAKSDTMRANLCAPRAWLGPDLSSLKWGSAYAIAVTTVIVAALMRRGATEKEESGPG